MSLVSFGFAYAFLITMLGWAAYLVSNAFSACFDVIMFLLLLWVELMDGINRNTVRP